jgi:hypothetical protein
MLEVRFCGVSEFMAEAGTIAQIQSPDERLLVVKGASILVHI